MLNIDSINTHKAMTKPKAHQEGPSGMSPSVLPVRA